MRRKRAYISLPEKLAATLACLLPQEQRDDLRSRQVPAKEVISLFHFDHIALHSFGGADLWFNLDPKSVAAHKEKSKRDTSIAFKAKRIDKKWAGFSGLAPKPKISIKKTRKWPSLKINSRRFRARM